MTVQQAAAVVIGMDLGTTVTAVAATIGGSVHAKRTGYAHVMYNVLAGAGAFLLLVPFMHVLGRVAPSFFTSHPELVLVGFHSFFNLLGVTFALPFASNLSSFLIRIVPLKLTPFSRRLDYSLLGAPAAALDALGATLADLTATTFEVILRLLSGPSTRGITARIAQVREALSETRSYVESIETSPDAGWPYRRHLSAMHVIDHLDRVADRCTDADRWITLQEDPQLATITRDLAPAVDEVREALVHGEQTVREDRLEATWQELQDHGRAYRESVLERVAIEDFDATEAMARLDAARGARRVAYHAWRITHHLNRCRVHAEPVTTPEGAEVPPHAEAEPPEPG